MDTATLVERGFATAYFLLGLSISMNPGVWKEFLNDLFDKKMLMPLGIFTLFFCTFMAVAHNIWEGPRAITTVIAWMGVIKSFAYMTFPQPFKKMAQSFLKSDLYFRIAGVFAMSLSILIFYFS